MHHARNGFLTAKGRAATEKRSVVSLADPEVDMIERLLYLDSTGSVSGPTRHDIHWNDALIEEQYRRFLNGS